QAGGWQGFFAIRTSGELSDVLPSIRRTIEGVDSHAVLWYAHSMDDLLGTPLSTPRLSSFLLTGFGLVALMLAAIGLYGVMASAVREQTGEIGIRMALGAEPERVRREVLGRALRVVAAGGVIGLVGALLASRFLASLLFQVTPADPVSLAGACLVLFLVALL